jgi:hypothetical protein
VEEAAVWILLSNIEQSEALAESKVDELQADLDALREKLEHFPELGESDEIQGVRKFPIYEGRYSVKWVINPIALTVTLIALSDLKYPKNLRQFQMHE